ncbi:MAG: hypothetical protein WA917_12975 [Comamonas sp.]
MPESDFAILESGFVHAAAEKLTKARGVRSNRDTLHGDPAEVIVGCGAGQRESILAMHARRKSVPETAFPGSVTAGSSLTLRGSFVHRTALRLALAQDSHAHCRL